MIVNNKNILSKVLYVIIFVLTLNFTINGTTYANHLFSFQSNELEYGDTLEFGKFYFDNSTEFKPIEWYVIDKETKNGENKVLLFSKCILYASPFTTIEHISWEDSNIRKYLNGEFYKLCFDENEENAIIESKISGTYNAHYIAEDRKMTKNKIFLLSSSEIKKYFYDEIYATVSNVLVKKNLLKNDMVLGIGTEYAKNETLLSTITTNNVSTSSYWLRSIGCNKEYQEAVIYDGNVIDDGYFCHRFDVGVRPAMWVKINNKD